MLKPEGFPPSWFESHDEQMPEVMTKYVLGRVIAILGGVNGYRKAIGTVVDTVDGLLTDNERITLAKVYHEDAGILWDGVLREELITLLERLDTPDKKGMSEIERGADKNHANDASYKMAA